MRRTEAVIIIVFVVAAGVIIGILAINKKAGEAPKQRMERVECTCRGTCVSIWHDTVGGGCYLTAHNGGILEVPCEESR